MKYDLQGTTMQILNMEISGDETIVSESGRLVFMSDNIKMETKARGGLFSSIKRKFAGESFFLVNFSCSGGKGIVAFGSEFPGKIIPVRMKVGNEIIAQKDAFICSEDTITFDATFTKKIGAGLLGGEGLILIKLKGAGMTFFNVGGEVTQINLRPKQVIRVDTGNLAMFDSSVEYSVERIRGVKNMIWGGEGLFLATMRGPGRVWIQSMPVNELAGKIAEYLPSRRGSNVAAAAMLGSALLRKR